MDDGVDMDDGGGAVTGSGRGGGGPARRSARLAARSPPASVDPPASARKRKAPSIPSRPSSPAEPLPPTPTDPAPLTVPTRQSSPDESLRPAPPNPPPLGQERRTRQAEAQRMKAVEVAPDYAFFTPAPEEEEDAADEHYRSEEEEEEPGGGDWPGPFSTAMKIINDRAKLLQARSDRPPSKPDSPPPSDPTPGSSLRLPPSLRELSLATLADYAVEIKSLRGVPDEVRTRLSRRLCHLRKMDEPLLRLFLDGAPFELAFPDCSWATEDQLHRALSAASTELLSALELNMSGRCLHDGTLAGADRFPALTSVSLRGAYRLSDEGLEALAEAAPRLRSVDLSQCSRLTSPGLARFLSLLRQSLTELRLDDCGGVQASSLLSGLQSLDKLEALSVAGVEGVNDRFVRGLVAAHGQDLADLGLCRCRAVTEAAVREIARGCPSLRCIDLRDLVKLDDRALAHLAGAGGTLRRVLLRRSPLSDKALAAFLEAAGGGLTELAVNNVKDASDFTAQAVAGRCAASLLTLDLSFCRRMTIRGLALIADSCPALQTIKLFGCPQISAGFAAGRGELQVVGLNGPILASHFGFRCS